MLDNIIKEYRGMKEKEGSPRSRLVWDRAILALLHRKSKATNNYEKMLCMSIDEMAEHIAKNLCNCDKACWCEHKQDGSKFIREWLSKND